jgi:hypothetical protein
VQKDRWTREFNVWRNKECDKRLRAQKKRFRIFMQFAEARGQCFGPALERLEHTRANPQKSKYGKHLSVKRAIKRMEDHDAPAK